VTSRSVVPREARPVREDWRHLAAAAAEPPRFAAEMVTGLPDPVRRWLTHAIPQGTPLWRAVVLSMRGEIRLGRWRPFTACQVLAPPAGYIWAATARLLGLPVTGYDRLSSGTGQMRWRLLGMIPVVTAEGPDVTRSAAGRLAGEITLVPTAFRWVAWTAGPRDGTAVATCRIGDNTESAELLIDPAGRLREVVVNRWGNPGGEPYGRYPFGVSVEAESAFGGITIPSHFRAGWWWGTSRQEAGEFFRAGITGAIFS